MGEIEDIEDGAEIQYSIQDSTETAYLSKDNGIAEVNGITYGTLKLAIDACSAENNEEPTTIKLLKNIGIGGDSNYQILEGQNINLDLNGYKLQTHATIKNSGRLQFLS